MLALNRRCGALLLTLAAGLAAACTSGPGPVNVASHDEQTRQIRADKDQMLRTSPESPIPADKRAGFAGLAYYDIKPEFHVPAFLIVDTSGPAMIITLQTSTNVPRQMRRVIARFHARAGELQADGLRRPGRFGHEAALRAFRRSHQ
jgi:uncharacterized protein (DUF1684 family)